MSKKCKSYSVSKIGLEPCDSRMAFYAGWEAAMREALEAQEPWKPDDMAYRPGGLSQHVTDDHQVFKLGYAKGVDDAERRAKAWGEQPAAVVKKPVSAIHFGWDRLDNGQLVATYFLPVAEMAAPKLYTAPQPARQPLTDEQIDNMVSTVSLAERDMFRRFARAIERPWD